MREGITPAEIRRLNRAHDNSRLTLAELMGIIVSDGWRRPPFLIGRLSFAAGTPYHTVFAPNEAIGEQVMQPGVARVLRGVCARWFAVERRRQDRLG